jgi:hypothetical protein
LVLYQGKNGTFIMFIEGDRGIFEVTPSKGINEASFLIRVKDPTRLDFEKVTGKHRRENCKLNEAILVNRIRT